MLCNFDAAACNLKALLELAGVGASIRSHRRLHAKLYIGDDVVAVGSSNPSRYGLTQEGDVVGGTVEANLLTDDQEVVQSVRGLFNDLWRSDDEGFAVTPAMIRKEIRRRELDPPPPPRRRLAAGRLLAACREAPNLFSSVFVCAYDDVLGKGGAKALRELKEQAADDHDGGLGISNFRRCWGYQFADPPPDGAWIIDLDCKGSQPKVHGASRVPTPAYRLAIEDENDLTPTVRGTVSVPGARGDFKLSEQDRADLVRVAKKVLKDRRDCVPLPEVVALIDGRRSRKSSSLLRERKEQ